MMIQVPIDPGGGSGSGGHSHPLMPPPHPLSIRAGMETVATSEQILNYGPPRGRGGDMGPSGPSLQSMPHGTHHFHGPPPQGWLETHHRGSGGSSGGGGGRHPSTGGGGSAHQQPAGPPRRSPRTGPAFRFDFPPPQHPHNMHSSSAQHQQHGRHQHQQQQQQRPAASGNGGDGASGGGGPASTAGGGGGEQFISTQQQRHVPSPRNGMGGTLQHQQQQRPQAMRPGVAVVCGPRRRPEHLRLVGPLGDPMFVGSPTAIAMGGSGSGSGGGGCGSEANTGPETVSRVLIPNCKIGAVIGKGGAIIKHIREVSGAKVTISDSCTGLHDDADDRMVTAAGTFNSVQLAFTHILSHAGAVGPDADPVMGLAGGDPDCVANSFRLLIPNVKAGGLIGRGGCTIKAIREHSGARIEISSNAFHFHPIHGPLPAPTMSPSPHHHGGPGPGPSCGPGPNGGGGGVGGPRVGGPAGNGFGSGGPVGGVPAGSHHHGGGGGGLKGGDHHQHRLIDKSNIILPPAILMDRVLTAMGSFDACLRAHHLVASKLMDVRPSPVPMPMPMPPGPPPVSTQATSGAAAALAAHARGSVVVNGVGGLGHGPGPRPGHGPPRVFNFDSVRGGGAGGVGGSHLRFHIAAAALGGGMPGTTPTASTSPASSVSELSTSCRQHWNPEDRFEDRSWATTTPLSPPLPELRRAVSGVSGLSTSSGNASRSGRVSASSSPDLVSSSPSAVESPRSSSTDSAGSAEALIGSNTAADAPALISQLSLGTAAASSTGGGGAALSVSDNPGALNSMTSGGVLGNRSYVDDGELPACLVDIIGSFFGGSSSDVAAPPRSPSTITGVDVEVGRAAFALLGVRDLDDIKHLSGAGIIAPESPESYCHLSGEVVAAAAAVLSVGGGGNSGSGSRYGNAHAKPNACMAPADGLGLAAAESKAAASAAAATAVPASCASSAPFSAPGSSSSVAVYNSLGSRIELALAEGFSKEDVEAASAAAAASSAQLMPPCSQASVSMAPSRPSSERAIMRGGGVSDGRGGVVDSNANNIRRSFGNDTAVPSAVVVENKTSRSELDFTAGPSASGNAVADAGEGSWPAAPLSGQVMDMAGGDDGDVDTGAAGHNPLKTVRITGTAEEVQLAEYLIRVRTAGRYMVAA